MEGMPANRLRTRDVVQFRNGSHAMVRDVVIINEGLPAEYVQVRFFPGSDDAGFTEIYAGEARVRLQSHNYCRHCAALSLVVAMTAQVTR